MDLFGLPPEQTVDIQIYRGSTPSSSSWVTWMKRRGTSWVYIFGVGGGGNGGNGAIGAVSTAAGGGGGGSGGQTVLLIPAFLLPDTLYVTVGGQGNASRVSIYPDTTAQNIVLVANGGGNGGNASGATAGAAGSAGAVATAATMPLGAAGNMLLLAGQAGLIGGTTVAGGSLNVPTTGLRVTGGGAGGGLPASGNGTAGGPVTGAGQIPTVAGGESGSGTTTPPGAGRPGFNNAFRSMFYSLGGSGGGSTHATATGAGLVQAAGGAGGIGSGGGGSGGALTGSTSATGGQGGPGLIIIASW